MISFCIRLVAGINISSHSFWLIDQFVNYPRHYCGCRVPVRPSPDIGTPVLAHLHLAWSPLQWLSPCLMPISRPVFRVVLIPIVRLALSLPHLAMFKANVSASCWESYRYGYCVSQVRRKHFFVWEHSSWKRAFISCDQSPDICQIS